MAEKRKKQLGKLVQSPDFKNQWIKMRSEDFMKLHSGTDLEIISEEGGFVTFRDRRSKKEGLGLGLKPRRPRGTGNSLSAAQVREAIASGMPEAEVLELLRRRKGPKLPTAGRKTRPKRRTARPRH